MHGHEPKVSVITTLFGTPADLLRSSIDSILNQTLSDLELILVVDGILDPAQKIVVDNVADDERVHILTPGRVGRGRCLNVGLAAAVAPLIAIQDADDESHPERLARQVEALDDRPTMGLVGAHTVRTRDLERHADWDLRSAAAGVQRVDRKLLISNPIVHSSVMARRELLETVGGYADHRRWQFDYDLYLRLRRTGGRIGILQDPLVLNRIHGDQFFRSDAAIATRLWSLYRIQVRSAWHEPFPYKYIYAVSASLRLPFRMARRLGRRCLNVRPRR